MLVDMQCTTVNSNVNEYNYTSEVTGKNDVTFLQLRSLSSVLSAKNLK